MAEHKNTERGKLLRTLFFSMLKTGAFTFGGGYAMIALLRSEFCEKKQWIGSEEFMDLVAIAESTPGPIAINSATYIGYRMAGFIGALVATVGMVLPSLTIIWLISLFFDAFLKLEIVANAFRGIRVCVVFLILNAGWKMLKEIPKNALSMSVFGVTVVLLIAFTLFSVSFSTIFYILLAGLVGVLCYFIRGRGKEAGK